MVEVKNYVVFYLSMCDCDTIKFASIGQILNTHVWKLYVIKFNQITEEKNPVWIGGITVLILKHKLHWSF